MSGGRSYAKKELTAEERLQEVERKYEVIQQRIQAYDAIIDRQNEVEALLPQLNKMIWSCNDYIMKLEVQIKELAESFGIRLGLLKTNVDSFQTDLTDLKDKRERDKDFVQSSTAYQTKKQYELQQLVEEIKRSHEEISKNVSTNVAGISSKHSELSRKVAGLVGDSETLSANLHALMADVAKVPDMEAKFYLVFDEVKKALESFKQENGVRHVENMRILEGLLAKAKGELKMDLQAAKEEILGTPTSNAQVKAQIMQKLEMATLDASNACIKASNIDQQVKLLEKKIESVRLQIKKDELSRNE